MLGLPFRQIWVIDFEFIAREGEIPQPVCLVAKEIGTGRLIKLWQDQLGPEPPRLPQLLEAMLPGIAPSSQALGQALLRGRYTAAVARMEHTGVPVDAETLTAIRDGWEVKSRSDSRGGCRLRSL